MGGMFPLQFLKVAFSFVVSLFSFPFSNFRSMSANSHGHPLQSAKRSRPVQRATCISYVLNHHEDPHFTHSFHITAAGEHWNAGVSANGPSSLLTYPASGSDSQFTSNTEFGSDQIPAVQQNVLTIPSTLSISY